MKTAKTTGWIVRDENDRYLMADGSRSEYVMNAHVFGSVESARAAMNDDDQMILVGSGR